jgi:hypothetical protein
VVKPSHIPTALAISWALLAQLAWTQGQQKQPQWKDRAEYDLYESITKQADAKKALELLDSWKQKYPTSEYAEERLRWYIETHRKLNSAAGMMAAAKEWLGLNPKSIQALYYVNLLTPSLNDTSPDALAFSEKAGKSLLAHLDEFFAPEKKPAGTSEADWKKGRADMAALAHRTLGWVALSRKDYGEAEKQLLEDLRLNPNDAEASAWLGTAIVAAKKVDTFHQALFHFARAGCYEGPGALDPARRKQMYAYFEKAYTTYHGKDPGGLEEVCNLAKTHALPPADFKILSVHEIAELKEKELKEKDPQLAFWVKLRDALKEPGGDQYFETGMKDALVPPEGERPLRGRLVRHSPAKNPKELVLALSDEKTPEVTLRLEEPLTGAAEPGTVIQFRGVPKQFTREPFMLVFEAEKENITGWPAAVPKKAPPAKKAVKKKA